MEEIYPEIPIIRMSNETNNTHHLIFITKNIDEASMLHEGLLNNAQLKYTHVNPDLFFLLVVDLTKCAQAYKIPIQLTTETEKWMEWIDGKKVTHLQAGYLDNTGKASPFGEAIPL